MSNDNGQSLILGDLIEGVRRGISYKENDIVSNPQMPMYFNMKTFRKDGGRNPAGIKYFGGIFKDKDYLKSNEIIIANTDVTNNCDILGVPADLRGVDAERCLFSHHVSAVSLKSSVDKTYLYYFLLAEFSRSYMREIGRGTTVQMLDIEALKKMPIWLPPTKFEQKKIAEILTSVDRVIELTLLEIDKLKDLKKGMMQELLTKGIGHTKFKDSPVGKIPESWERKNLNDVCERINVGFVGTCEKFYTDSGVPMIRTGDLADGSIEQGSLKYVVKEFHLKNKKSKVGPGDILIARHGKHGNASIVPNSIREANCLNVIIITTDKTLLLPEFLKFYLNSELVQSYFRSISAGSTQSVINTSDLINLDLNIPELKEQNKIIEIGLQFENSLVLKLKSLEKFNQIKKGLMNDLLTGKVRVKV